MDKESQGTSHQELIEALFLTADLQSGISSAECFDLAIATFGLSDLKLNSWNIDGRTLTDITGIKFFDYLVSLELAGHNISDLTALRGLKSLKHLDLSWNRITDISVMPALKDLKSLDLSWNGLTQVNGLQSHPTLQKLVLTGNPLNDLSGIDEIPTLTELSASLLDLASEDATNGSFQNLDSLGKLDNLNRLDIQANSILDIDKVAEYPNLENLDLSDNQIPNLDPLFLLDSLKYLFADYNPLEKSYCSDLDLYYCEEPGMSQQSFMSFVNIEKFNTAVSQVKCPKFGGLEPNDHRVIKMRACLRSGS